MPSDAVGRHGRELKVMSKQGRLVPTLVSLERMDLTLPEAQAYIAAGGMFVFATRTPSTCNLLLLLLLRAYV